MTIGVKDQPQDQSIYNKRATCSNTICMFLDHLYVFRPLKTQPD